jgi:hypothetical protein
MSSIIYGNQGVGKTEIIKVNYYIIIFYIEFCKNLSKAIDYLGL